MLKTIYENQWCKIVSKDTLYILKSKNGKYNDQYFTTLTDAYKAVGIIPKMTITKKELNQAFDDNYYRALQAQ